MITGRMEQPKISIIVPVYNCGPYLPRCIDSLLKQTLSSFEIVAINNGSTDDSGEILARYAKQDGRILVFTQDNQGPMGSRNTGLREARGEYIAFVDADDYVESDFCALLLERIESTGSEIAICDYFLNYPEREEQDNLSLETTEVSFAEGDIAMLYLRWFARNPEVWNKLYRRQWLEQTGVRFEVQHGEDMLFNLRLLPKLRKICTVGQSLYHYVQRKGSLMYGRDKQMQDSANILEQFIKEENTMNTRLLYFAFSSIFAGFMFSNFVIDRPLRYFRRQISALRGTSFFEGYCRTIAESEDLAPLYREQVIGKHFYTGQKLLFGLCGRGWDGLAAVILWLYAKWIIWSRRSGR